MTGVEALPSAEAAEVADTGVKESFTQDAGAST